MPVPLVLLLLEMGSVGSVPLIRPLGTIAVDDKLLASKINYRSAGLQL